MSSNPPAQGSAPGQPGAPKTEGQRPAAPAGAAPASPPLAEGQRPAAPAGAAPASPPPPPPPPPATVSCTIDGKPYTFPRGTLIVNAVREVGRPIPYYCYHPKLAPVGACRVCMVSVLGAPLTRPGMGAIVTTGCTTPVFEGLQIETMSEPAKLARKQVLQFLLINHPLDCPVCDKGGECDLQDFTLGYGPGVSEFAERKILRRKADDLGPFLVLDQERCIMCQRCVRYENEVTGEQNLVLKERGDRTVIDTGRGEPYPGYFSGNNTELCPVGALTSRTYRFKARPWDVRPVPTVCQGCAVGCNATVNLRSDRIVRLLLRDNPQIDGGWLCDRGRYGFGHTTAAERLTAPMVKRNGELVPVSWEEAVSAAARGLRQGAAVLGGARLTDEEALLLSQLTRVALRTNDVDWRVGYQTFAAPEAAGFQGAQIADIDTADLVLLCDTSLLEEAPVVEIRLRRAAGRKAAVIDLGPVQNFTRGKSRRIACAPEDLPHRIAELADEFGKAAAPLVIWNGRGGEPVAEALRRLGARLLVPGEFNNARGAEIAGLVPDALPGYHGLTEAATLARAWGGKVPSAAGRDTAAILAAAGDAVHALYLVGANPLRTFPDGALAAAALDRVGFLVVQDLFLTEAAQRADVVLPALGPLEKEGHVTNMGGVRQAVRRVVAGPSGPKADGEIFRLLATALGVTLADAPAEASSEPVRLRLPAGPVAEAGGEGLRVLVRPLLYAGGGTAAHDPNFEPVRGGTVVRLHPEDAAELGLGDGAAVHVGSGAVALRAVVRCDADVVRGDAVLAAHGTGVNRLGPRARVAPAPAEAVVTAR